MAHPSTSQTLVGIAFYNKPGNLQCPHWSLVLHRTHYDSKRVRVYQIRRHNDDWVLDHRKCHLTDLGDLIGVLHMTVSPHDIDDLDGLIRDYPAGNADHNPGQVFVWSDSAWVIRALYDMDCDEVAIIPGRFRVRSFWEMGIEKCHALREEPRIRGKIPIISWPTA